MAYRLVLATRNKDKAAEFRSLLDTLGVQIVTLDEFPGMPVTTEDRETLEGNAFKKAQEAFGFTGLPSLADDSGLEVYYLNGEPGVYSSRYAGPGATYADNCARLLRRLRGVPARRRAARFRCVLALIGPDGRHDMAEGICKGEILESPRGTGGFGYDPLFVPDGHLKTFAEMSLDVKNQLSHRAKAIQNMRARIVSHLSDGNHSGGVV